MYYYLPKTFVKMATRNHPVPNGSLFLTALYHDGTRTKDMVNAEMLYEFVRTQNGDFYLELSLEEDTPPPKRQKTLNRCDASL